MQSAEVLALQALAGWVAAGKCAWLATVVQTLGSAPRPVGAAGALPAKATSASLGCRVGTPCGYSS
ncbi:MAG: XdhC family protein [Gammaproteobacteria bacterium]